MNNNNYNLSLTEFQQQFKGLSQKDLHQMFKEAALDEKTDEIVKKAYKEYLTKKESIKKTLNYYSFKIKENKRVYIDLDKYSFKLGKNYHPKHFLSIKQKKKK